MNPLPASIAFYMAWRLSIGMTAEGEFYVHREWSETFREPLKEEEYHIVSPGFKEFCESVHMGPVASGFDDFARFCPGYTD